MRNTHSLKLPLALLAATLFVLVQPANAHDSRYDRYQRYDRQPLHVHRHHRPMPHWLRTNYGFMRWYDLNSRNFKLGISWKKLHRHYQRDYRYHRNYKLQRKAYKGERHRYNKKRRWTHKRRH